MSPPSRKRTAVSLLAGLLLAAPAAAQTPAPPTADTQPEPPELLQRRAAFTHSLRKLLEPLNRSYLAALKKAERQLALDGDYAGAIAAGVERQLIADILIASSTTAPAPTPATPPGASPAPAPPEPALTLHLPAADALASGRAKTAAGGATLAAEGDTLTWKLPRSVPGGFEVSITYSSPGAATFWVRERFFRLKGEVAAGKSTTAKLGTLKVTADAETITLQAIEVPAGGLIVESLTLTQNPD